jgi:predicted nicotinamide N-methyase
VTVTVILFTNQAPSVLAAELSRAGIRVYEALAISEVLALVANHPGAQIVITSDVEPRRVSAIQGHHATLVLKAGATAADLVWELEQISPGPTLQQ